MLVCENCGGKNIQVKAWVDANTNNVYDDAEDDTWCDDCQENDVSFIDEKDFVFEDKEEEENE